MTMNLTKSKIKKAVTNNFPDGLHFKPSIEFFGKIGINKRRWGKIYRDEASPTLDELNKISQYFEIPFHELIDNKSVNKNHAVK